MTIPVLTFFNNKGGVGKTSLVYHLAWMMAELGMRILAVDLDPQANLTAAFLDEDRLLELWEDQGPTTVFRCVQPLLGMGDILAARPVEITPQLYLLPGDLALSNFEDQLSEQWPKCLSDRELERPFRILTAFWQVAQQAAAGCEADLILVDVGPHLGAINRSVLIASDHVVIPLGADLYSLVGLRNLGPKLREWRNSWTKRRENWEQEVKDAAIFPLPTGAMAPTGYIAQQHSVRLSRPVKAYDRWLNRIPKEYRQSILGEENAEDVPVIGQDPHCLAMLRHYQSLIPMAQEARKPLFSLKSADGAIGTHAAAVRSAYGDFEDLARKILLLLNLPPPT